MSTNDRHDLRRQTREIRDSLSRYDREQLVDILTHVFRTYVLEGAAMASAAVPTSTDELAGLSFAQVIERLQLRLELPELQLFEVSAGRVSVRIDGRPTPLELPTARGDAHSHVQVAVSLPPVGTPVAAAAPPPRGPSVDVREVVLPTPAPTQTPAGHASSSRPEPRPGAVRATGAPSARPAASPSPAAAPAAPATPAAAPSKPEPRQPEPPAPGGRFGLLEVD